MKWQGIYTFSCRGSWRIQIVSLWSCFVQRDTWTLTWNIYSISLLLTWDHFVEDISFVSFSCMFFSFFLVQYTCADVSNEMKVLEQEVFWLTILSVLKRPLADMLEVHRRIEEITDTEDLHAHAATSPFEVLTAFDFLSSVESWDHNYLP